MERAEKDKRSSIWITILIFVLIAVIAYFAIVRQNYDTSEEIAKCIGEKSILYVQLGCSHCQTQEEMFGENVQYLTIVDCFYEYEKCANKNIASTPTWIINHRNYEGVLSIDKLRELTKC
jgi:flagellar basal body-associated protein FliL